VGGLGCSRYDCKRNMATWRQNYTKFDYGKPLVPKQVHVKLPFTMKKFHKWYHLACIYGLNFIEAQIARDIFKT
jgi:hypothetical protein